MSNTKRQDELLYGFEEVGRDVANAWGVPYKGIVTAEDVPTVKVFIQWQCTDEIKNIASVAYCPNLMCHIFFIEDGSIIAVQQCSMRVSEGVKGFLRLVGRGTIRKPK